MNTMPTVSWIHALESCLHITPETDWVQDWPACRNRTPNGSSTAKPILNTLNYDLGIFKPYSKWADTVEITDDVPWKRNFEFKRVLEPSGFSQQRSKGKRISGSQL